VRTRVSSLTSLLGRDRNRNAAILLGAAAVLNLLGNVAFHVLAARKTDVSTYGLIATLLSLGIVASALGSGLQYVVARHAAIPGSDPRGVLGRSVWSLVPILVCVALVGFAAGPASTYLHAGSPAAVDAGLFYFGATIVSAVPVGVLMAQQRFGIIAASVALSVVLRVGLALVLGLSTDATVIALMTSAIATIGALIFNASAIVFGGTLASTLKYRQEPRGAVRSEGIRLAFLGGCLWSTWLLPISFARHYLSGTRAGHFSVGHLAGSSLLFLAAPVATAYFPAIVRSHSRRPAATGLFLTAAVGLVGALGLGLLGPVVFTELFGVGFPPSHELFFYLGLSAAACAVATYVLWTSRARGTIPGAVPAGVLCALALELLLGIFGRHTSTALAISPAISISCGGVVGLVLYRPSLARRRSGATAVAAPAAERLLRADVPSDALSLLPCLTVGVMAHNESATIRPCLEALLAEQDNGVGVGSVVVVVSGSTDGTPDIVRQIAGTDRRVHLVVEPERTGKVNAVNLFLEYCKSPLVALVSGDVLLTKGSLVDLVAPFRDPRVGMTGGRIQPLNEPKGICNRLVILNWELHDAASLRAPKLGEAVLFRRIFRRLDATLTDEVLIEANVVAAGYELRYVPGAVILNHGPSKFRDYVRHRVRINVGHMIQQQSDGYTPSTLRDSVILLAICDVVRRRPASLPLVVLALVTEMYVRAAAALKRTALRKRSLSSWEPITSAKRPLAVPVSVPVPLTMPTKRPVPVQVPDAEPLLMEARAVEDRV